MLDLCDIWKMRNPQYMKVQLNDQNTFLGLDYIIK